MTALYKCRVGKQCAETPVGINIDSQWGGRGTECVGGSTGPLCGTCEPDHMLDRYGRCHACERVNKTAKAAEMAGLTLMMAMFVLLETFASFRDMQAHPASAARRAAARCSVFLSLSQARQAHEYEVRKSIRAATLTVAASVRMSRALIYSCTGARATVAPVLPSARRQPATRCSFQLPPHLLCRLPPRGVEAPKQRPPQPSTRTQQTHQSHHHHRQANQIICRHLTVRASRRRAQNPMTTRGTPALTPSPRRAPRLSHRREN